MTDITIRKVNDTWMKVKCKEVYQELDIQDRFSFEIPNAKHDPRVKKGQWDGIKKLYNRRDKKMYVGLLYQLIKFCDKKNWSYTIDDRLIPDDTTITQDEIKDLCETFIKPHSKGEPIEPYDYQLEAVEYMLNMDRSVCLAATSAGKSLIIYIAVRLYQVMDELDDKTIFITVPNTTLVEQLYNDFQDYSTYEGSDWFVTQHCQKISGKYTKFIDKQIVITTWQSMSKLPYDVFGDIGAIFIDETHTAQAKILSSLIESAVDCPIRHGLTGTLDDVECNELVIQGLLGPAKRIVTAREIIDKGRASDVDINMLLLEHTDENRKNLVRAKKSLRGTYRYQAEVEYINALESRREFLLGMIESLEGNTLVIFDRVNEYGKELYEVHKERNPDNTFLVVGEVAANEREEIRQSIEQFDKSTIFASFGTMSTGTSIKKLHNLVIISSSKGKIRILQTLGRMMRLHFTKDKANVYDIVDNFTYNDEINYTMNHASTRLDYYKREEFNVNFMRINLN